MATSPTPATQSGIVIASHGENITTTLAVAEGTGVEHASVIRLVRANLADLEEFGLVRFQIRARSAGQHGGGDVEYAELNEQQATLILTYMRNSEVVRSFKKRLVREFWEMRRNQAAAPLPTDYAQALRALACEVEEKERIAAAKALADAELVTARPKAVACDVLSESKGDRCIRTAAKDLKVPERQLIATMIEKGWLFRTHRPDGGTGDLQPTAKIAKLGFAKMTPVHTDAEKTKTRDTLRITNAGLTRLAAMLVKWGLKVGAQTAMVPA
jgi:phage regulator Rha-like protein